MIPSKYFDLASPIKTQRSHKYRYPDESGLGEPTSLYELGCTIPDFHRIGNVNKHLRPSPFAPERLPLFILRQPRLAASPNIDVMKGGKASKQAL